ncbi:hypothetical protein NE865_05678 [Phthorimaea operculella]|nr:hypothetical protein NE865_05678 [Phthorimaea operculella]
MAAYLQSFCLMVLATLYVACQGQCIVRALMPSMAVMDCSAGQACGPYEDSSSSATEDLSALLALARALEQDKANNANNGIDVNALLDTLIHAMVCIAKPESSAGGYASGFPKSPIARHPASPSAGQAHTQMEPPVLKMSATAKKDVLETPKICTACLKIIETRQFLKCSACTDEYYDLDCAQVTLKRYLLMTPENKIQWKCPTSLRNAHQQNAPFQQQNYDDQEEMNITIRKKNRNYLSDSSSLGDLSNLGNSIIDIDSSSLGDISNLGDTMIENYCSNSLPMTEPLTLSHIAKLLDIKLEAQKQSIIQEIKESILTDLKNSVSELKTEMNQKITILSNDQEILRQSITEMEKNIHILNAENTQLKRDLEEIHQNLIGENKKESDQENLKRTTKNSNENFKKIVIHGLIENYWETDIELEDRVINVFKDILNVNVAGYVEDLYRVGRKSNKRPIVIEFLSKRLPKHLLQNKHYFKNSGLAISEYLDEEGLKQRKKLREVLFTARKNGKHAVIRNNKLIVDGLEYKESENEGKEHTKRSTTFLPSKANKNIAKQDSNTDQRNAQPQTNSFRERI